MYGYGYPPPWGYTPPPNGGMGMDNSTLEKGMRIAMKISQREAREKERHENRKKRDKMDEQKQREAARSRTLTSLEWFIIGVVLQPFVGPLYNYLLHNAQTVVK